MKNVPDKAVGDSEAMDRHPTQGRAFQSRIPNPHSPAFHWPVRVYWEDTDAGGVVYHAGYLRYFERARSEWLRARGFGQQQLREADGIVFVVHRMEIAFRAPARLDDLLDASVAVESRGGASFTVRQALHRADCTAPLVDARVRIACVDAARFRPHPIPRHLLAEIAPT
jgi:acyl-CoA thioester hydrolase